MGGDRGWSHICGLCKAAIYVLERMASRNAGPGPPLIIRLLVVAVPDGATRLGECLRSTASQSVVSSLKPGLVAALYTGSRESRALLFARIDVDDVMYREPL